MYVDHFLHLLIGSDIHDTLDLRPSLRKRSSAHRFDYRWTVGRRLFYARRAHRKKEGFRLPPCSTYHGGRVQFFEGCLRPTFQVDGELPSHCTSKDILLSIVVFMILTGAFSKAHFTGHLEEIDTNLSDAFNHAIDAFAH